MRPRTMRFFGFATAALLVVLVVVGIANRMLSTQHTSDGGGPRDGDLISNATFEPRPALAPCPAALIEGTLLEHSEWVLALRDPRSGALQLPVWPHGYVARVDGDTLLLVDSAGDVIARVGDEITAGGGMITFEGQDAVWMCTHIEAHARN